jgi:hypothetical protein
LSPSTPMAAVAVVSVAGPAVVKSSDAADNFVERLLQQAGVPDSEEARDAAVTTRRHSQGRWWCRWIP